MDEEGIIHVCEVLGLSYSNSYEATGRGPHISISCPLALARHEDSDDKNTGCSVKIVDDGPSVARCWSANCNFAGPFLRLIREAVNCRPNTSELTDLLRIVESEETLTFAAVVARNERKLAALNAPRIAPRDRDVLPESDFDPFRGRVPSYAAERGLTAVIG